MAKLKFLKHIHDKARDFFKKLKFAKNLVQPMRDYDSIVHKGYMKTLRLMDWRLDDLLSLNNQGY